ncbi:MAG: hypothetical protein K0S33_2439 [Bacteroidetes bacterium]|nr:hypothetical protein [Bacteroidota bacterium]
MNAIPTIITTLSLVWSSLTASAIEKPKQINGVFGVCSCQSENSKNKLIELSVNKDNTFNYVDNSDPAHKQLISGTWEMRSGKLILESSDGKKSFHRKWKYSSNGQCIKSRYRLNFRRICMLSPC